MSQLLALVLVIALAVVVLFPTDGWSESSLDAGTIELRTRGDAYRSAVQRSAPNQSATLTYATVGLGAGYFVTSIFEVFGDFTYTYAKTSRENGATDLAQSRVGGLVGIIANFHSTQSVMPFVSIAAGPIWNARTPEELPHKTTIVAPSIDAGVRVLVSRLASLNFSGYYQHERYAYGQEDTDADKFGVRFGISLFLR